MDRLLTGCGGDVNIPNERLQTPLHLACLDGDPAMVRLLLTVGAIPNRTDLEKTPALMYACRSNAPEAFEILLRAGADPSVTDAKMMTPLMHAASQGSVVMLKVSRFEAPACPVVRVTSSSDAVFAHCRYSSAIRPKSRFPPPHTHLSSSLRHLSPCSLF